MAQNSKIEWTHHTGNLWSGCTKVHEGCDHCYAETLSKRWGNDVWGNDKPRLEVKSIWDNLAKFQKLAKAAGEMHRVFVGSMMDIFEKPMPLVDSKGNLLEGKTTGDLRNSFFAQIDFGRYENLMFLLLTKRPSNINKYIPESWKTQPPSNVMFGTSPVNQETFDKLVNQLLQVKGKKFLSVEPQLAAIDLNTIQYEVMGPGGAVHYRRPITDSGLYYEALKTNGYSVNTIDWVIQGGESGHHKRPFNLDWAYSLNKQCEAAGIPYFFKQIDKVKPIPADLQIREFPKT